MSQLERIYQAENQLQNLMDCSDHGELAQSIRLLALYVASYKEQHGELDNACLQRHLLANTNDPAAMRIFENGLHEAIAILSMIRLSGTSPQETREMLLN